MRGAGGGVGGAGTNMRSEARQAAAERAGCCLVLALLLLPPAAGLPTVDCLALLLLLRPIS
jgi:hypothetical protein